jgi:hypothetical protein
LLIHPQAISSRRQGKSDIARRKLAVAPGVSLEQVNYCIKALVDKGYVKVGNFAASKNRFGYACLLAPAGVVEKSRLTAASIASKLDENNAPHDEINALVECREC